MLCPRPRKTTASGPFEQGKRSQVLMSCAAEGCSGRPMRKELALQVSCGNFRNTLFDRLFEAFMRLAGAPRPRRTGPDVVTSRSFRLFGKDDMCS